MNVELKDSGEDGVFTILWEGTRVCILKPKFNK